MTQVQVRIGLIARADNTGLGNQTWEFFKHIKPSVTMVVDIGHLNGNVSYYNRYENGPNTMVIRGFPTDSQVDSFLQQVDVVFVAEAAYNPYLYTRAQQLGKKIAVQYNYEFFDWFTNDKYPMPDMLIAPSKWHYDEVDAWAKERGIQHVYLHCPVNTDLLQYRQIKRAKIFLHIAGKPAAHDRNGTRTVIEASGLLKSDAKIHIHFQGEQGLAHQATYRFDDYNQYLSEVGGNNVMMQQWEYDNYSDIYKDADVLLLPRRYGGNCLPMNEALAIGMPVIMTDISPNNQFLPHKWLIPSKHVGSFTPRTEIDIYEGSAQSLAEMIDHFATLHENEMYRENIMAGALGDSISWKRLGPRYLEVLEGLWNSQ